MAGRIIQLYNLSVLRACIIGIYLKLIHVILQLANSSWRSKYLTNEHNNNWKKQSAVFMHGTHSYYDMGVDTVDCGIVIVHTLHV